MDWCPCFPILCGVHWHHIQWAAIYSYHSSQWLPQPHWNGWLIWNTGEICQGNKVSCVPSCSVCHPHCRYIPRAELWQQKGMNCVCYKMQGLGTVPGPAGSSARLLLPKPYVYCPYSMFSAKECHCSLAMVQIYVNKLTFSGHLVPVYPWLT